MEVDYSALHKLSRERANRVYLEVFNSGDWKAIAELGRRDRFFLLCWLCDRPDANRDWVYARCREVEAAPYGYLDLWARFHYKSTIVTFAGIIQQVIKTPEARIAIFSHNNRMAQDFLRQIKNELSDNVRLLTAYPDVLYANPEKESPLWSAEKGIVVRRKGNPKEATVQAHGLIDGMPTGAHFTHLFYDDVATQDNVTTTEQMSKTLQAFELSCLLVTENSFQAMVGTRYHFADVYRSILDKGAAVERRHPATVNGDLDGEPVLLDRNLLEHLRYVQLGPFVYSAQMLLNPVADEKQGFKREWLKYWDGGDGGDFNRYILVDPANERKRNSDYTAAWVIGLGADRNYYVLDIVRDRLNLTGRADMLFALHKKWKPLAVGYEKYGKDSDIQHFQERMNRENYRFSITGLSGKMGKADRIRRMAPLFEGGRFYFPEACFKDSDGKNTDLVRVFVEQEYLAFPVGGHDDMLDALARILDADFPVMWPESGIGDKPKDRYQRKQARAGTWMSA